MLKKKKYAGLKIVDFNDKGLVEQPESEFFKRCMHEHSDTHMTTDVVVRVLRGAGEGAESEIGA